MNSPQNSTSSLYWQTRYLNLSNDIYYSSIQEFSILVINTNGRRSISKRWIPFRVAVYRLAKCARQGWKEERKGVRSRDGRRKKKKKKKKGWGGGREGREGGRGERGSWEDVLRSDIGQSVKRLYHIILKQYSSISRRINELYLYFFAINRASPRAPRNFEKNNRRGRGIKQKKISDINFIPSTK